MLFRLHREDPLSLGGVAWGVGFGALGAGVAAVFAVLFKLVHRVTCPLEHRPVLLATWAG